MPPAWTRRLEEELLADQVTRCYERSPFYRRKLAAGGVRPEHVLSAEDLRRIPFTTKEELRASQEAAPPLGDFACADLVEVVRVHLTSGTTGKPLALGYTAEDLKTSARIGARAFWAAGARPDDVLLHCLNYSFYTGGLADHDGLEETGATMVPVGLGQSKRLLELWDDLRPTALFSTLTYPLYLAETAEEAGVDPRALGLRKLIVAGEPGGQLDGTRRRLEELWGATMRDTYGLSDVWGTFAAECERARRAPLLRAGRRPRRAGRPRVGRAGRDRARGERRARLHAPRARGDAGPAFPLPGSRGDPRGRVPLRPHRLPLPGRRPQRRHVPRARGQRLPQRPRRHPARARARPLRDRPRAPSPSSRRWSSWSRASTAGRRSWSEAVKARLGFTCVVRPATLPRSEAKTKRLYRLYEGEERP